MSESAAANRYARALFELGVESRQLPQVTTQVRAIADAYAGSKELQQTLSDPTLDEDKRFAVLVALGRRLILSPTVINALKILVVRRRLGVLPEIAQRLSLLADERDGILRATVTTAVPLGELQAKKLTEELERLTGKRIVLERQIDSSLVAGLVTRIGDHVIDGSLRGRFQNLEHRLLDQNA